MTSRAIHLEQICVYACTCVSVCVCMNMHVCTNVSVCMHVSVCMLMCVHPAYSIKHKYILKIQTMKCPYQRHKSYNLAEDEMQTDL